VHICTNIQLVITILQKLISYKIKEIYYSPIKMILMRMKRRKVTTSVSLLLGTALPDDIVVAN